MFSHPYVRSTRTPEAVRNGLRDWFRVSNAAGDVATIDIFSEIGWFGITAKDFKAELDAVTASEIRLNINSPGGDVFDGIAIYNLLREHSARIETHVVGLAASAASFIALAGDEVVMAKHAQMMIHDAWGLAIGNARDMRDAAEFLDRQSDVIASIYADRAGGTTAEWRARMADETWYSDEEAVEAGLAHKVGSQTAAKNTFDLSVFRRAPAALLSDPEEGPAAKPSTPAVVGEIDEWVEQERLKVAAEEARYGNGYRAA